MGNKPNFFSVVPKEVLEFCGEDTLSDDEKDIGLDLLTVPKIKREEFGNFI